MGGTEKEKPAASSTIASLAPQHTASETAFQEFLETVPAPTEHTAAEIIAMILNTSPGQKKAWNVTVLVDGIALKNPALDWHHVAALLDLAEFQVPDEGALEMLMRIWRQAISDTFPLSSLVGGLWKNAEGQLSFLRQATRAEPEVFSWAHAEKRQDPLEGLTSDRSPSGTSNSCWLCLDLYTTLAALAASGYEKDVRSILEHPLKVCPELFVIGAATVEGGWGPLQSDVDALVGTYLQGNPNSSVVLRHIWPLNGDMVLRCMAQLQQNDPTSVSRLLDVCQELRVLSSVLEATPPPFCLELAALASRREYLNLEKWLCDQFTSRGVTFMQASVSFLDAKLREDLGPTARPSISVETLAVFLKVLAANAGEVPTDTLQQLKLVQAVAVQAHPELATVISEAGVMEAFPQDVEEEANSAFQRMYQGELSVDDVIQLLVRYKAGMEAREQDVYACMAHNLFDEFRFFYKYPEQELQTTALLFGKLISNKLVSPVSLGIAMRYIYDSLKNEPSHKLFKFGVTASMQFKDILGQFPTFSKQIVGLNGIKDACPELYKACASVEEKPETEPAPAPVAAAPAPTSAATFNSTSETKPSTMLFSTINADTLEQAAIASSHKAPDQALVDKVHFLVNNITNTNIDVKVKELAGLITADFYPWFANYLVVKRAAQEPNFHPVYVMLVEKWGDKSLRINLVDGTVHYCKVMLDSELLKSNSSERTLLKNLGSWLGKLTLGCNKPVLQKHIDIKQNILNAYSKGMMLPILSFVRHLMEPCATSVAFRPPNPWTMAVLALLVEVYNLEGIRTSIKFEVELLFKHMDLLVSDVEPSNLVSGLPRDMDNNMDFAPTKAPSLEKQALNVEKHQPAPALDPAVIASLPNLITISPQLSMIAERLQLKGFLNMSIERALVEIIAPVVDRSVTIACMTCQQLVCKDFASEGDVDTVRRAANTSVAGLAQSLALVTAREPLRLAVTNNLRSVLSGRLEPAALEQVITVVVSDNLDLCCQIVEKAAGERSKRELDERLAQSYTARAKARASGETFIDRAFTDGQFPAALPDVLKAKPGALTPQQQKVYQDFATIPRTAAGAERSDLRSQESPQTQLRNRFLSWIARMDNTLLRANGLGVTSLNDAAELKTAVAEVVSVPVNEMQAIEVAKNVFFSKLYQSPTIGKLTAAAYVASLVVLRDKFVRRLSAEAALWFAQLPDDLRGYKDAGEALIRSQLVPIRDMDAIIAKALNAPRYQPAAELLLGLLQSCVLGPDPCMSTNEITASIDMLSKLAVRVSGGQGVLTMISQARQVSLARSGPSSATGMASGMGSGMSSTQALPTGTPGLAAGRPQDSPHLVPSVMKAFDQWARLLEENICDRAHNDFVKGLRETGLLGDDETNDKFFRVMTQLAVTHCLRSEVQSSVSQGRPGAVNFVAIDAFVRLMVTLVLYHGGGKALLAKILGAVATCLFQMADDRAAAFSGRPFFRIIVGLLAELSPLESVDESGLVYVQAVSGFLYATRPQRVPAFAFPWLQLVSDRRLMPPLLMARDQAGWPTYITLLLSQLQFLEPFLKHAELTDVVRLLYKGTLRLFLVLLHDFPEFLAQYHFRLCDAIPLTCVQLRNLVLSAFPARMKLPDPFTGDMIMGTLPEVRFQPKISPAVDKLLPPELANEIDMFIAGSKPILTVKDSLKKRMVSGMSNAPSAYNIPAVNSIVLYIGLKGLQAPARFQGDQSQKPSQVAAFNTPAVQLYAALLKDLDPEGRYVVVNAMANHLRFPNAHTQYFSFAIMNLFENAQDEKTREQITRVLLERLIANRPHPWGLLVTFIELIKNPRFNLLSRGFTKVSPEIERLFESVSKSIGSATPAN
mmetsp:Transcript_10455/g.28626  ORF Transcript_10455/g.28626 Transcript_10455/m.28626 type:complete len:1846 (+) Transcript_10455:184-5721(+)